MNDKEWRYSSNNIKNLPNETKGYKKLFHGEEIEEPEPEDNDT